MNNEDVYQFMLFENLSTVFFFFFNLIKETYETSAK